MVTNYADLDPESGDSRANSRVTPLRLGDIGDIIDMPPRAPGLAVLIPYRDRAEHLQQLIPSLSAVLQQAGVKSNLYVIEQANNKKWNKGAVYNAGFDAVYKKHRHECFCFHDVDFIPQSSNIHYGCVSRPTHLAAAPSQYDYKVPYIAFMGGVLQMSARDYIAINGYSNRFWLWGKEDDDVYMRFVARNMSVAREDPTIGQYQCLDHERDYSNVETNVELLIDQVVDKHQYRVEGLNSINYSLIAMKRKKIGKTKYVHIKVDF